MSGRHRNRGWCRWTRICLAICPLQAVLLSSTLPRFFIVKYIFRFRPKMAGLFCFCLFFRRKENPFSVGLYLRVLWVDATFFAYPVGILLLVGWWYVGDFETNASCYEPHELVYTLRAFGHLNYVPPNSSGFFAAVERILMSKFSAFDPLPMLEMLVSFVYIERFPVNFLGHVFSPHFLMQIKGWCIC